MRSFGCKVYTWVSDSKRRKLDDKGAAGVLVGYTESNKIYRIYYPESRKVDTARDVVFNEEEAEDEDPQHEESDLLFGCLKELA